MLSGALQKAQLFKLCSGCAILQKSMHGSTPVKHEDETTLSIKSTKQNLSRVDKNSLVSLRYADVRVGINSQIT